MHYRFCFIVPVYNASNVLHRSFNSIFSQNYKDLCVIAINDGSTDNSFDLLKEFECHDNFYLLNKKNGGASSARNFGLNSEIVKNCDYISFIDADDWIPSDYLDIISSLLEKESVDAIYCKNTVCKNYDEKPEKLLLAKEKIDGKTALDKIISSNISRLLMGKFWKKEIWENIRFEEDIKWCEDNLACIFATSKCQNVLLSNYNGYCLNRISTQTSLTRSKFTNNKIIDSLVADKKLLTNFKDLDYFESIKDLLYFEIADNFLSMLPRFKWKQMNEEQKHFVKQYRKDFNKLKILKSYKPNSKNNKMKKIFYRIFPHLYIPLMKVYLHLNKNKYRYIVD